MEGTDYIVNKEGILYCTRDIFFPMKREGNRAHLHCRISTMKFVCLKVKWKWDSNYEKWRTIYIQVSGVPLLLGRLFSPGESFLPRKPSPRKAALLSSQVLDIIKTGKTSMQGESRPLVRPGRESIE